MATRPTLIDSVVRALSILDAVGAAELPQPAKKLARETGIPLPTAYHLLRTLVHERYLQRSPARYSLGARPSSPRSPRPAAGSMSPPTRSSTSRRTPSPPPGH